MSQSKIHNDIYVPNQTWTYHSREEASEEEHKASYDVDIIDTYASRTVNLPTTQTSFPLHDQYLPSPQPRNSPLSPKSNIQVSRDSTNDEFVLRPVDAKEGQPRGFWASFYPDSVACRLYVLTVLIETIIDIAIEADLLVRAQSEDNDSDTTTRRLPVYLAIFGFAHLFQLIMAVDAVYARNTLQFLFLTLFNALFLVYAAIQITEIREAVLPNAGISHIPVNVLTTIIPIMISIAEIAYIALGWKIWGEFGWKVYKYLGADRRIKRMFAQYQIFICLIKFDVFFFIGFSSQLIWLVLNKNNWEYYVTCAALPCSFVLLAIGHIAARRENKHLMGAFLLGCLGAMVYFVYKLYKMFHFIDQFRSVIKTLTVFAVIAIFLLIATFISACIVTRNFGQGLKQHLIKPKTKSPNDGFTSNSYPMSTNVKRMSIE